MAPSSPARHSASPPWPPPSTSGPGVVPRSAEVSVHPFDGEFSSWGAFTRAFKRYQRETHQLYRVRTTNSVAGRNRAHERQVQLSGRRPRLLDEGLGFYSKTFICTHGWRSGASRGSGNRHHVPRSTSCPAKLNALLRLVPEGGRDVYRVCVKSHTAVHNHEMGSDVYFSYAEARKVTDAEVRRRARRMWEEGAAVNDMMAYLREASGKPVRRKDVDNMVVRWRSGRDAEAEDEDEEEEERSGGDWMEVVPPSEYREEGGVEGEGDAHYLIDHDGGGWVAVATPPEYKSVNCEGLDGEDRDGVHFDGNEDGDGADEPIFVIKRWL